MVKPKHICAGAAAFALLSALPGMVSAQEAADPHAGHHPPAAAAPATPVPPSPAPTPSAKPDGMSGGGLGMMDGMGGDCGKMPMMGMMGGGAMQMGTDVEGRIAALRTELKITGPQAKTWNAFADVLRANVGRAHQVHAGMMAAPNDTPPSLPQRLERHERMLIVGLDNIRALKPALVRLYSGLSIEQKSTADRLLVHEAGMMPGMQMGGMPMSGMPRGTPKQ